MSKRIIGIGDLHSGSMYALLPPDFETYDGSKLSWNKSHEYLWKCWDDFTLRAEQFDPDYIIVNGDCIEGPQKKSNGFELTLASQDDQVSCCLGVLQHLKNRVRPDCTWYFTAGTPYHVGEWHTAEESIARTIGARPYASVGTGKYCREVLWRDFEGVIVEATHHTAGSSGGFYRATVLDRDGQWAAMAAKDSSKGVPKVDVHLRSHLHYFCHLEHASKQLVLLPCWKLGDRHSRKSGLYRFIPDIGGVFLVTDGEAKKKGEVPCLVERQLYPLPPIEVNR